MSTLSSGTYDYKVCVKCVSGGTETVREVVVPHPVMMDGSGNTIVQLTSVTLGGFNGLNS